MSPKKLSFYTNFTWASLLLIGVGLIFASVGLLMQFVPLDATNFSHSVNGSLQPFRERAAQNFRLLFLFLFGLPACALLGFGIYLGGITRRRAKKEAALKRTGKKVYALVIDLENTALLINNRRQQRLSCLYETETGQKLRFKSYSLRLDPLPYLSTDEVMVYFDPSNPSHYFVDLPASAGTVLDL